MRVRLPSPAWLVLAALLATASPAAAQDRVFFGNLHSHTSYSDGSGTPADAYRHARDVAGLDFLAITEHNHRWAGPNAGDRADGVLIATSPHLYNGSPQSLVAAANTANQDDRFVALYGQEFSTISSGNHVNAFGLDEVITSPNGLFRAFSQWLGDHPVDGQPALLQFNHPAESSSPFAKEYGRDDFPSRAEWIRTMDGLAELIEVVNGPAMTKTTGKRPADIMEVDYLEYLNLGFHLGPTADQDNHYPTWGDATEARTGVIAPRLTRADIMAALRQRHVYASEDRNLQVIARVNGRLMGDVINTLPAVGAPLDIRLTLHDPDEPNARYQVHVFSDRRAGGPVAASIQTFVVQGDVQNHALTGVTYVGSGQYLFLKIRQTSPSGANADRVWTAPVWFEAP